ncbi:unnamed protein product [Psylliodes chrysocephalus]|uniref:HAT C-terminal dimerisation domain-containing protein n=1 Tax=Psylliodes chrysocephalus TaxID=3402493 RepID=A0A9P0CEK8_9CUCU|nr:unnamed protein product [Psylliodes chrysocephala]
MDQDESDKSELHNFRLRALDFYIELSIQIKKRFNFGDPVLDFFKILNPEVAVSGKVGSIVIPANKYFPDLVNDIETLNTEWRMLAELSEIKNIDLTDPEIFWSKIFSMKNELNEQMFPSLKKLVEGLLSLPHSSAAAERMFSQVTLLKTKCRNRLEIETLDSILHVKELLSEQPCYSWEPSVSLLKRKIDYSGIVE